jgi:hypothetical protein
MGGGEGQHATLSEGGKGGLSLLDAAVGIPFIRRPVVSEGGGGEALLFLLQEGQGFSTFLFFGHGRIAFVVVV